MTTSDAMGDRMKRYEQRGLSLSHVLPGEVMIARLDGRGFSRFTKGMKRPYDKDMTQAMVKTAMDLFDEFSPNIAYVQSDEITLVWVTDPRNEIMFGGRVQKINSSLAASASVAFNANIDVYMPGHRGFRRPTLDSRVFTVPSRIEAMNNVLWRQMDATKNAISMAAQSMIPHSQLQGKNGSEMQEMMFQLGTNFDAYPYFFKRGTFVRKETVTRAIDQEVLAKMPDHIRKEKEGLMFERSITTPCDIFIKMERGSAAEWADRLFGPAL